MFCVKTASRTYEMSASDTRQRQEWTAGEYSLGGLGLTEPQLPHLQKGGGDILSSRSLETGLERLLRPLSGGGLPRGTPNPGLAPC